MEEEQERFNVAKMAANYAEYWGKKGEEDELVVVCGHKEAGKSVVIDLLADK